jgi:hypothetical protein
MISRRLWQGALIAGAGIAMTLPVWAKSASQTTLRAQIDLTSQTKLAGKTLQAGHYMVIVNGHDAKFERDGKTVADVSCNMKTLHQKARTDAAYLNGGRLTEVQFAGKTEAANFSSHKTS